MKAIRIAAPVALLAAGAGYWWGVRPWHLHWGATPEECVEPLPGDGLVPEPKELCTHAITINAPVEAVWPWLVQIGRDRAGFYSYDWLENLLGCDLKNADEIVPMWQGLEKGDLVWLHPQAPPLPVLVLEPYRTLVMGPNTGSREDDRYEGVWGFHLREIDPHTTRLIARGVGMEKAGIRNWMWQRGVFEPAHFVMERKMLLGIRERAEAWARSHPMLRD